MKNKVFRSILAFCFTIVAVFTVSADDDSQPPPEDCYGYEVFGSCLTYQK